MASRSGFLSLLVVVVLLLAGAFAAWVLWRVRLPDPADCDRAQLVRWLVTRDLSQESFELRRSLLRRLEEQIERDPNWRRKKEWLTEDLRKRLDDNVALLVEPWFVDKLEHYVGLPPGRRAAYVDQVLEGLAAMRRIGAAKDQSPGASAPQGRLVKVLLEQVPRWQQQAEPQRRREIEEFFSALQAGWLMRQLFSR